jgi:hypothetical protein
MLAGLLFADHEAVDRAGQLTATLPFGGVTLIEYQARLLLNAGAAQLVVSVGRLTPELLGALARIGKRGLTVDAVRSAEEAAGKLHPLARVVMLADGLVTTQDVIDRFAQEGGDALLVMNTEGAPRGYERLGGGAAWAGVARIPARRIVEVAALPRDYDLSSTTLRLADQARADHLPLTNESVRDGHAIEHSASALASRGRAVLAATVSDRRNWFNAFALAPIAKLVAPRLVERGVATAAVAAAGGVMGATGAVLVGAGMTASGLIVALIGCLSLGLGRVLASLRDETGLARAQTLATAIVPAAATAALGWTLDAPLALASAVALLYLGAIGERAVQRPRRRGWWGSPPAYLLLLTIGALAGSGMAGLLAATLYAAATLAAAVESTRPEA